MKRRLQQIDESIERIWVRSPAPIDKNGVASENPAP